MAIYVVKAILLCGSLFIMAGSISGSNLISENSDLREFCLLFALPGRTNGPDIANFEVTLNDHLNKVGNDIFGYEGHDKRMSEAGANCTFKNSFTPKCAYFRLSQIGKHLISDMQTLERQITPGLHYSSYMYINLLSTWYMDRVFMNLECGPVDVSNPRPTNQWEYIAEWSNLLQSRQSFCTWSKSLHKSVATNLRKEVRAICDDSSTESICHLLSVFDLIDSIDHMCSIVPLENWTTRSKLFNYTRSAVRIYFFFMKYKMPEDISNMYDKTLTENNVRDEIYYIMSKFIEDFKINDLSLAKNILKILPKTMYMPCDYNAPFPTFKWVSCSAGKTFEELRLYIQTYDDKNEHIRSHKFLSYEINQKEYIKELKISQIKELAEMNAISLQIVSQNLQNNIQDRFSQLGEYFEKVATFQQKKLNADVAYIKGRIETYWQRFRANVQQLQTKMRTLLGMFVGTATADLAQAVAKLIMRIAMGGNPLKWLTGSGNADDILESATEVAEASRRLTESIRSVVNFHKLVDYSIVIAKRFNKNARMLKNIRVIMNKTQEIVEGSGKGFEEQQSIFLQDYNDYSPQVTMDDLAKLDSYWDLFIEEVCEGIASSNSIVAQSIRGIGDSRGKCREVKITASQLVATQEEIYSLQFELVETMAQVMGRLTQIESSKIIGKGPRATNSHNLTTNSIGMLMAVSSISNTVYLTTNVQKLCDTLEYKHGKRHHLCNGLATDIDKLTNVEDPFCRSEFKYITVSTKKQDNEGDFAWLDLRKLYKGETASFQVPNSKWWIDHARISPSQQNNSFYLSGLEVYMPTRSLSLRSVYVHVTPTNIGNRLRDDSNINYVISPLSDVKNLLKKSYEEGPLGRCRQKDDVIDNPYRYCAQKTRPLFKDICPTGVGWETNNDKILLPSIYSKLDIRIEGYENLNLGEPVTDVGVQIGVRFCSISSNEGSRHRKKRRTERERRESGSTKCCSQDNHYFSEWTRTCQPCPVGSKSYFNSLFCGQVITIRLPEDLTAEFTYEKAVTLCQQYGSSIASSQLFKEAQDLGQKSCACGWVEGSNVDSLTARSVCTNKSACTKTGTRSVHCKAVFST